MRVLDCRPAFFPDNSGRGSGDIPGARAAAPVRSSRLAGTSTGLGRVLHWRGGSRSVRHRAGTGRDQWSRSWEGLKPRFDVEPLNAGRAHRSVRAGRTCTQRRARSDAPYLQNTASKHGGFYGISTISRRRRPTFSCGRRGSSEPGSIFSAPTWPSKKPTFARWR